MKSDLQTQYTNYKNTLQSLAQKIGEIEQDIDEHRYGCKQKSIVKLLVHVKYLAYSRRGCFCLLRADYVEKACRAYS
jgi:hypothetical protein